MVTSVNQLSLYGAVTDMIAELPVDQRAPGKPVASLQEYEERFERLSEDQKLSRLCSEAVLTLPRDQKGTEIKGWIQSNVRFDTVSDVKICNKQGRYSIEVQVQSLKKKTNPGSELRTVLTSLSEKSCRSKRKRKLRGEPLRK